MHQTIFATPIINTLMCWLSRLLLRLLGWRIEGGAPAAPKYVLIGAPHTSNWDFPFTLMVCFALRLQVYWMGKASLFPPVLGHLMRWLGGIPVDRSRPGNLVPCTVAAFEQARRLTIVISPEGTRAKASRWKTGFYYIAQGANVPIALGFLDFKRKVAGIDRLFEVTGDIEADMAKIQASYANVTGKNPRQF